MEIIRADSKYHNHGLHRRIFDEKKDYWVEVIGRPAGSVGYVRLPRRWVVERTFAWLGRYRRNSRDYERLACSSESMIRIILLKRMLMFMKHNESKKPIPFKYRKSQGIFT